MHKNCKNCHFACRLLKGTQAGFSLMWTKFKNGPGYVANLFKPRVTPYNLRGRCLNVVQTSHNIVQIPSWLMHVIINLTYLEPIGTSCH